MQRSATRAATLSEIRSWPPTVSIPAAAGPIGISRSYAFELARTGKFPCRVIMVGSRYRVVTSSLVALLEGGVGAQAAGGAA
jgi:hypothetical protein